MLKFLHQNKRQKVLILNFRGGGYHCDSFLTKGGNYSREETNKAEETIQANTVYVHFIVNQGFIRYKDSIKVFALIKTDFVKV